MSSITSNGSTVSAFFQWSCVQPILWKIWKVVIAVYFLAWLGISIHDYFKDNPAATNALKWLVFLTHWTYLFFTSYLLISAGNACLNYCCHRKSKCWDVFGMRLKAELHFCLTKNVRLLLGDKILGTSFRDFLRFQNDRNIVTPYCLHSWSRESSFFV